MSEDGLIVWLIILATIGGFLLYFGLMALLWWGLCVLFGLEWSWWHVVIFSIVVAIIFYLIKGAVSR